jgi:hypothetical protein
MPTPQRGIRSSSQTSGIGLSPNKRAAGQEIEDGIMVSPRQLEAAFHGEKETQTSPEDRPEAAGS